MYLTKEQAIRVAKKQAALRDTETFVIADAGEYDACTAEELETYYFGLPAQAILHCIGPDGCFS